MIYTMNPMNHKPHMPDSPFGSMIPVILFVTGMVFCALIWLINIYVMATSVLAGGSCFISTPYIGLSYVQLCVLVFSGFILIGALNLICSRWKLFSAALIISCISIGTNVLLLRAGLRAGHRDSIQRLEESLLSFDANDPQDPYYKYPSRVLLNHEALALSIDQWNKIESKKITSAVDLVSVAGTWKLETESRSGVCHFSYEFGDWDIGFILKINDEVLDGWCNPIKISKTNDLYKIRMSVPHARTEPKTLSPTSILTVFKDGFYMEINRDRTSFVIYENEAQIGASLGPFIREPKP